jgi:spore germination protein
MKRLFLLFIILVAIIIFVNRSHSVTTSAKTELIAWFAAWDNDKVAQEMPPIIKKFSIYSPMLYRVMPDSSLGRHEISNWDEVVAVGRNNNVPIIPAITDEGDIKRIHTLLYNEAVQKNFIREMIEEAKKEKYGGYGIDIEMLTSKDKTAFSNFTIALSKALHQNKLKLIMVAYGRNAAETYDPALAHDYKVFGEYSDLVELMTYGYNSESSTEPGGESPLEWYSTSLQYAIDNVPRDKLVVGLSTHGNDWGDGEKAEGLTYQEVEDRIKEVHPSISYNKDQLSYVATYKKDEVEHTMYFENAQTILQKMDIAKNQFGINKFAFWRLSAEDQALWKKL